MDIEEITTRVPGFKFSPSDETLLLSYLRPKIYGEELPCNIVQEKEIYSNANPWHLFHPSSKSWIDSGKSEKSVYVFTCLTKLASSSGSNNRNKKTGHYTRRAGCGTWHDETCKTIMSGENNVIGYKRMLVYQINDIGGLGDGIDLAGAAYWKMHEYFCQ